LWSASRECCAPVADERLQPVGGDVEACNIKGLGLVTNRAAALGAQQPIDFVLNLVQFAGVAARAYPLTERVKPIERIADFFGSIVAKIFAASSSNGSEAAKRLPWPHGAKSQIIGSQSQDPSVVFLYVLPHLRGKSFQGKLRIRLGHLSRTLICGAKPWKRSNH
jgi:hypothetical protein